MDNRYFFRCFGSFVIEKDGEIVSPSLQDKTLAMVAYLACATRPQARRTLAELFCSEAKDQAASLRWHISRIRKTLGADCLQTEKKCLFLPWDRERGDIFLFSSGLSGSVDALSDEALAAALALYRGPFLDGCQLKQAPHFDLWLMGERGRFGLLYEAAMQEQMKRLLQTARHAEAIVCARQLLVQDPLREEVHSLLMWLLAKSGQREAAIAQYALCKQLRREQLDVPLLEETELLYEQVLEGDFAPTFAQWEAVPAAESGPSVPEVSPDHGEWPALSEAGRYALETLSLAVCPLSLHSLSLASHQSESEIVAAIEHGLALGWLATDVDGERYSFIDDQVKASFSSGLSAIRCQLLHKHLAEALRQVHATSAELAYHWGEAGCRQQECEALQSAAKDALDAHQFHEVARCYGRCVALSQTASEQVSFLQLSGEALQVLGRWREAEEAFTTSLALAKQARLPSTLAQSALLLGQFALAKSDWSRSLHWLEQAKGAFEALGEQEGVFLVWGHLSSLFRRQGDMEKALSACKMQVSVADSLGNNTLRSKAQGALSGLYAQMGREEEALDCFRETLTLASQMPSLLSLTSEGDERYEYIEQKGGMQTISRLLERSAWLEAEQDQFLQAMQIVEEQLRFHLDSGQTERVHRGWEQLSSWYAWMGDVEHSMRFALRLFGLAVERMSFPGLAQSAGNIGALYTRYGDGQKARVCYQMKCSLSLDLQEPRGVSNGLRHLAELSWCEGDEAMAFSCLSLATTLCQQNQLQTGLSSCLLLGFALRSSSDAGAWRDFVERFGDAVPASEPDFEAEVERAARRLYDLRHAMQQPKPSPELPALMQQQHQTVEDVLHRASKVFGIDVVLLG